MIQTYHSILHGKLAQMHYDRALFESYTEYNSSDYVSGLLDGVIDFHMSDLKIVSVKESEDGTKSRTTQFEGIFSASHLNKTIIPIIKIRLNSRFLRDPYKNEKINMDSQQFEKYFDVYSDDKILALRILTADIMDYILTFKQENNIKFEITIRNSMLYIRIHCKNMFESNVFKDPLDMNTLHKYFNYLDFICQLNKKFNKILSEKDL